MKQRVITGIIFTLSILAFVIPAYFYSGFAVLLTAIVALISAHEMSEALRNRQEMRVSAPLNIGAALSLIPVCLYFLTSSPYLVFTVYAVAAVMFSMIAVIFPLLLHKSDGKFTDGVAIAGASLYISFPLACANTSVLFLRNGWLFFVLGLFAPWISDVFAYFTGVLIGRHKIVPHISPKKTWEGCIGGAVGCATVIAAVFSLVIDPKIITRLSFPVFLIASAAVGLILSVVSQFGDWTASAIKRWAGIKDFGSLLPGHGGILDRFDSAFFTLPVAFAFGLLLM